jgi:hypothetical protein
MTAMDSTVQKEDLSPSTMKKENTLVRMFFIKSKDDARHFRSTLDRRALIFLTINSLTVADKYEELVLSAEANEIHATHYVQKALLYDQDTSGFITKR